MKNLLFLCIATCIFILSVIVLNIAPIINGLLGKGIRDSNGETNSDGWFDKDCDYYNDNYKINKKISLEETGRTQEEQDEYIEFLKEGRDKCNRNKAMAGLEYSAFNANVIFGLTCAILGLLKYFGNNLGKSIAFIGIASGIIGFVLAFVYVIYSGIIFTQDVANKNYDSFSHTYQNALIKVDSEGAHLKWDDSKGGYVCIFYDKDNKDSVYLKYSDYGSKYLNYNKDVYFKEDSKRYEYYRVGTVGITTGCFENSNPENFWENCKSYDEGQPFLPDPDVKQKAEIYDDSEKKLGECDKLYFIVENKSNAKKILYNQWLTTIILGIFISIFDIGLTIFGFLLLMDLNKI